MDDNKMYRLYEGAKAVNSHIGENAIIGENSLVSNSNLGECVQINRRNMIVDSELGAYSYTGANTIIKKAKIGKFCSLSWNVSITGNQHDYTKMSTHPFSHFPSFGIVDETEPLECQQIVIGNDVWIGMNSCILPGIHIGNGAIVGAGSVVTKDVPAYAVVAGNPAKILKYRFDGELINRLEELRWWDWSEEKIKSNIGIFQETLTLEKIKEL